MDIPEDVRFIIENYETAVLGYSSLNDEQKAELEGYYLLRKEDHLSEENEHVRSSKVNWTQDITRWPNDYFIIGHDGCGNYYYLDVSTNNIGFYDYDEMEFQSEAKCLQVYISKSVQFVREPN